MGCCMGFDCTPVWNWGLIIFDVGDGSYSSVYKVKRMEDGCEYALKKVKI